MEQTSSSSSTSDSALLPSGTSVTFYQNGTDSLASKADCSCSGEDEEACFESGVASDDNSEALNRKLHYPDVDHTVSSPPV